MTTSLIKSSEMDIMPGMMKVFIVAIMAVVMADIITRLTGSSLATQYMQSRIYQGVTDPRVCSVTSVVCSYDLVNEEPFIPWVSANFINDGPHSVWVAINNPDDIFEVKSGESASVNRIGAVTRIEIVYFVCNTGQTAIVRVIGEY